MKFKFSLRQVPLVKSVVYSVVCTLLLLFSYSFVPALRICNNTPVLLVAAVCSLAYFEDVRYASFFALVFSVLETQINGTNMLVYPLFYTAFAIACAWLFERFLARNFLTWLGYCTGGLLIYSVLTLFFEVGAWGIAAPSIILYKTLPQFLLSAVLSLPLFALFAKLKRKTDKE